MKRLGIITLHGMGKTEGPFKKRRGPDGTTYDTKEPNPKFYPNALKQNIAGRLSDRDYDQIAWGHVFYQNILSDNQERYVKDMQDQVSWHDARDFMVHSFCDASTLESQKGGKKSPYFLAQANILETFRELYREMEEDAPLFIIAQSLGGQVISNYLWDAGEENPTHGVWSKEDSFVPIQGTQDEEGFARGNRLTRLFTTGCNIPLFVAGRKKRDIHPIKPKRDDFEWLNYYDAADVLGYPLRPLSDECEREDWPTYDRLVTDHRIRAGWMGGFGPCSHTKYWSDPDFVNPLVDEIRRALM